MNRAILISSTPARLSLVALLFFVAACARDGNDNESDVPDGDTRADGSNPANMAGALSEEKFMALHEMRGDDAPEPQGEMVEVQGNACYLSLPTDAAAPMPAVIVIQEWWGLNQHIKHYADRIAALGYAALAVDLYGGQVATESERAMELMQGADPEQSIAHLLAGVEYVRDDTRIQASAVASIGWCFGGGNSLQLAINGDLTCAVMFYGLPVTDTEQLQRMGCPLLGVFANEDASITPAKVNDFEAALTEAGTDHTLHRYNAAHAFANPSSAYYDQESAADAWDRVVAFWAEHLAADGE